MKIVVNDANILIDFCKLDMLDAFFQLQYDFHVVDDVWEELNSQHQIQLQSYIQSQRLIVVADTVEITDILQIKEEKISAFHTRLYSSTIRKTAEVNLVDQ